VRMEQQGALVDQQKTPNQRYEPPTGHEASSSAATVPMTNQPPFSTVSTDQEEPASKKLRVELFDGQDLNDQKSQVQPQQQQESNPLTITTNTTYTIKIFFGEPETPLRADTKRLKKDDMVEFMKRRGFTEAECNRASKQELLKMLQKDLPYVVLEIDNSENLERLLSLALLHWRWSAQSLANLSYVATLPVRSEKTGKGVMTFDQVLPRFFFQQNISTTVNKEQKLRENARKGLAPFVEFEPQEWRKWLIDELVQGRIEKHALFPLRYVGGAIGVAENYEVTNIPSWIDKGHRIGERFMLDLNSAGLRPRDVIRFQFLVQFQSPGSAPKSDVKILSVHVLSKKENSQPLPAVNFAADDERFIASARIVEANARALPFRPGVSATLSAPQSSSSAVAQPSHQLISQQAAPSTALNIPHWQLNQETGNVGADPFTSPAAVNLQQEMNRTGMSSERQQRGHDAETSDLTESDGEGFEEGEEDPFA
jgi:hypothetical protein